MAGLGWKVPDFSTVPCFKRLGKRLMARTFERQVVGQVVELHVRVALLKEGLQKSAQ
jgi:hypothetical protein